MNYEVLNNVTLNPKIKSSVNYAKARAAIEEAGMNRRDTRACKAVVIAHLQGVKRSININELHEAYAREEKEAREAKDKDRMVLLDKEIRQLPKVRKDSFGNFLNVHTVKFADGSEAKY